MDTPIAPLTFADLVIGECFILKLPKDASHGYILIKQSEDSYANTAENYSMRLEPETAKILKVVRVSRHHSNHEQS